MGYLTKATIDGSDYKLASGLYGTCSTAASTAAKVVTCADFNGLEDGVTIQVYFSNAQTATPPISLNVNSSGAKTIHLKNGIGGGIWKAEQMVSFTYYNDEWHQNDLTISADTKNTAGSTNSASKLYLIGATSQAANPQTYSSSKVYETDGALVADSFNGVKISSTGNNITFQIGSSQTPTTTLVVPAGSFRSVHEACEKDVDTSIASGSTSTNLPTTAAVRAYVDQVAGAAAAGALVYQGTVGSGGDIADLPAAHTKGWYYIVKAAGTFAGVSCEAGDMIICKNTGTTASNADWDVIQANIITLTTAEIDADWAAA